MPRNKVGRTGLQGLCPLALPIVLSGTLEVTLGSQGWALPGWCPFLVVVFSILEQAVGSPWTHPRRREL